METPHNDDPLLVAVTGASGHLGAHVCRQLLAEGFRVRALWRQDCRSMEGLDIQLVRGDMLDPVSLVPLMDGATFVIHAAASISVHGDKDGRVLRANIDGTANVLQAALNAGVRRLVHVSSTHAVRSEPKNQPFDENRPYKDESSPPYDQSKARAEQLALAAGKAGSMEVLVLRPSSLLGPLDFKPSLLGQAILDLRAGAIPALVAGGYDFLDVRDAARGTVSALYRGMNQDIFVLAGGYRDLGEFSALIGRVSGSRTPSLVMPWHLVYAISPVVEAWGWIRKTAPRFSRETLLALKEGHPDMRTGRARQVLGFETRPLEETIRDFLAWHDSLQDLKSRHGAPDPNGPVSDTDGKETPVR